MSQPPDLLYRYRPWGKNAFNEIAYNIVRLSPLNRESLNDPAEGTYKIELSNVEEIRYRLILIALEDGKPQYAMYLLAMSNEEIRELEKQAFVSNRDEIDAVGSWGVVCFTERPDNMEMWGRYAGAGAGVLIEYDLRQANVLPNALHKVVYQQHRGSLRLSDILDQARSGDFSRLLSIKSQDWEYEAEWRLLAPLSATKNDLYLTELKVPISRVITGYNMPNAAKNEVVQAVLSHGRARFAQSQLSGEHLNIFEN
jgi:hypothetical protein